MLDSNAEYQIEHAIKIAFPSHNPDDESTRNYPGPYLQWTGEGELTYEGDMYQSGKILSFPEVNISGHEGEDSASVLLDCSTPFDRDAFFRDWGPVKAMLVSVWRERPAGEGWTPWAPMMVYEGNLSNASYADGTVSIVIQRVFDDVWRGEIRRWTGSEQRIRRNGDTALDRADRARRSGLLVGWQA